MERYTKRLEDGQAVMACANCSESWNTNPDGKCTALYCRNRLKDRLAAYEDTGLEPCDYSAMAHALKQAERAREDLTEMIRQIGATGLDRLRELAQADREGRCVVLPCKTGDTVWFNTYSCNATVCHGVQPHKVKAIRTYVIVAGDHTDVGLPIETAGITWFLTENAARDALKGDTNG